MSLCDTRKAMKMGATNVEKRSLKTKHLAPIFRAVLEITNNKLQIRKYKESVDYVIRACEGLGELGACVALQKQIWGYAEHDVYPLRLFVTLSQIGGHVLGAFTAKGELVGFVGSMPAWGGPARC